MKKIVVITTRHTGCGHKSISNSLMDWFHEMPDVEAKEIDGFEELVNRFAFSVGASYGPTTRHGNLLWAIQWNISLMLNGIIENLMTRWSRDKFLKMLEREKPDVIVTAHPMFNTTLLNTLQASGIDIPFAAVQADPVTLHPSWCDARATVTFCATEDAVQCTMRYGVPRARIRRIGFPTRKRFTDIAAATEKPPYDPSRPLRCLLMSGGEGSGKLGQLARTLLEKTEATLTIVCGRNQKLQRRLEKSLKPHFGDRIEVLGFVDDVDRLMLACDLMIARGSPNTLYEAVVLNVPLIITGALPGQEQGNLSLVEKKGIGILCESALHIPDAVRSLLKNDGEGLKKIQAAQREFRRLDTARQIAEEIAALAPEK